MIVGRKKAVMPTEDEALPGRDTPLKVPERHFVNGHRIIPPFPVTRTSIPGMSASIKLPAGIENHARYFFIGLCVDVGL